MELTSVALLREAFYRLVGTTSGDGGLTEQGEGDDDVAYIALTQGIRSAQRWMLSCGYGGWKQRSAALTFLGTDAADGGRYVARPTDFLRADGDFRRSALVEADGTRWGQQIDARDAIARGNYWYIDGEQLWLGRQASPPTPVYLRYHYRHPVITAVLADASIVFPVEARPLIVAEAANEAKEENWLLGGRELETKIERKLMRAREKARDIARPTKQPRQFQKPFKAASRY